MFGGVTTKLIEKHLDHYGWKIHQAAPEPGEREGIVLTGWSDPWGGTHTLIIDPMTEKNAVQFRAPILQAPLDGTPADRLQALLLTITALNMKYILGGFAYNPKDGGVEFKLAVPIDDGNLTYETFNHCLVALTGTVDIVAPKLSAVASGEKSAQDVLRDEGFTVG
jgi:hypothetical protein